jgi:hypoxanthine-guanine phosphoribosyltransferase
MQHEPHRSVGRADAASAVQVLSSDIVMFGPDEFVVGYRLDYEDRFRRMLALNRRI